jgi:head-tail adaptor
MITAIRVGEMRKYLSVKTVIKTNEPITNAEVLTLEFLKYKWAKRIGPSSNELYEADQQAAKSQVRYFGRLDRTITEEMVITDGTTDYNIKGIEFFDDDSSMVITCEKRDNISVSSGEEGEWVLSSGVWNDSAYWDDSAVYNNG